MSQTVSLVLPVGKVIDINPPMASTPGWRIGQIMEIGNGNLRKIRFGDVVNGQKCVKTEWIDTLIHGSKIAQYKSKKDIYWKESNINNESNNNNRINIIKRKRKPFFNQNVIDLTIEPNPQKRRKYNNTKIIRFAYDQQLHDEHSKQITELEHKLKNQQDKQKIIESTLNGRIKSWKQKYDESYHNQQQKEIKIKKLNDMIEDFDKRTMCIICLTARRDTLIIGCYHLDICHDCASQMKRFDQQICPRCQREYVVTQRVNHPHQ